MTRKSKRITENSPSQPDEETPHPIPESDGAPELSRQEKLLAEARRALIEEQNQAEENVGMLKKMTGRIKKSGLLKKKSKKPTSESETAPKQEDIILDKRLEENIAKESAAVDDDSLEMETKAILEALEKAETAVPSELEAKSVPPLESTIEIKRVEMPVPPASSKSSTDVGYHELREVALAGYEEPTLEALAPPRPSLNDQVGELTGRVKYQTLMRITIASLTAVVCLATFLIGVLVLKIQPLANPRPVPVTATPTMPPPYPIQVRLTGGWMFTLSRGYVTDGKWSPTKAEWLEGTEICRWISLPWSTQLEAVFRSLATGDRIDLVMSNYDHWSYHVRSVQEMRVFELTDMDKNYPSLLLILTNAETDVRLVVLAVP